MGIKVADLVVPGDIITDIKSLKSVTLLGPGLRRGDNPNSLIVTRMGRLSFKTPNFYWIDAHQKRYVPKMSDLVVGTVVKKGGDVFKVDIGSSEHASLSALAFEGATKKQRPDLQVGDVVYTRLLSAHREMEPELVCIDKYFKAGILGQLSSEGFLINIHPDEACRLLDINNPLLRTLGKRYPYEIAVGMNGKVWINSKKPENVLKIMKAINIAEKQTDKQITNVCRQY